MARMYGIANTDQVNRQNMVIPVHVLTESLETHVAACIRRGLPIGTPFHLSHDMHRPVGWSDSSMIHLGPDMARQLVVFDRPESEADRAAYETLRTAYWHHHHHDQVEPFAAELSKRLAPADLTEVEYVSCEAPAFRRAGLAQELYPDLFQPGRAAVDKDGLVHVTDLRTRMSEVLPGVFHDQDRDVLLFAHRFFRRSLSHSNTLNDYALRAFADVLARHSKVIGRIRLDPDIVGYPSKGLRKIELEYWRGPKFNDDVALIPSGVAEHKMEGRDRVFSGVDKTQVWWKSPETRSRPPGADQAFRTFEVEELVENPSAGLGETRFGCRYAHAEYDTEATSISHFDGAIRAYDGESYLERIESAIDRAGKHADYTKLFRLDGPLPIADWKRLLCDFFRGNHLIPEYLGELPETAAMADPPESATGPVEAPALSALLRFGAAGSETELAVITQRMGLPGDRVAPVVELGQGAVGAFLRGQVEVDAALEVAFTDNILNISTLVLGAAPEVSARWANISSALAEALAADSEADRVRQASLAFAWSREGILYTLSLAGRADLVAGLLSEASRIVDPATEAASWIGTFNDALRARAPKLKGLSDWESGSPFRGRLSVPRTGEVEFAVHGSDELLERLLGEGFALSTGGGSTVASELLP